MGWGRRGIYRTSWLAEAGVDMSGGFYNKRRSKTLVSPFVVVVVVVKGKERGRGSSSATASKMVLFLCLYFLSILVNASIPPFHTASSRSAAGVTISASTTSHRSRAGTVAYRGTGGSESGACNRLTITRSTTFG